MKEWTAQLRCRLHALALAWRQKHATTQARWLLFDADAAVACVDVLDSAEASKWRSGIYAVGAAGGGGDIFVSRGELGSKGAVKWVPVPYVEGWDVYAPVVRSRKPNSRRPPIDLSAPDCLVLVDKEMVPYLSQWTWRLTGRYVSRVQEHAGFTFRVRLEWQVMFGQEAQRLYGKLSVSPHALVPPEGKVVDHANGNPLDNRRENLRLATRAQNATNAMRHNPRKRSPFLGVGFAPGRGYFGTVRFENVQHTTGAFATAEAAARARDDLLFSLAGEFGIYNFYRPALGSRCRVWKPRGTSAQL
jgi:hypothetical protein